MSVTPERLSADSVTGQVRRPPDTYRPSLTTGSQGRRGVGRACRCAAWAATGRARRPVTVESGHHCGRSPQE